MFLKNLLKISATLLFLGLFSCTPNDDLKNTNNQVKPADPTNPTSTSFQSFHCPAPTSKPGQKFTDIYFDVKGFDSSNKDRIKLNLLLLYSENGFIRLEYDLRKNGCKKLDAEQSPGTPIRLFNGSSLGYNYSVTFKNSTTNKNQVCKFVGAEPKKAKDKTNFTDAVVKIDCTTPVTLSSLAPKNQVIDFENKDFYLPKAKVESSAGIVFNPEFKFTSSDVSIAEVDEKTGKVKFKKPGKVNFSLSANPDFYTSSSSMVYQVEAKNFDIKVQKLEIGQSSILPIGSEQQIIAPNNKTLVRALVYSPNGGKINSANLTIKSADGENTLALTCPTSLNKTKFAENHFKLADTCYTILDTSAKLQNLKNSAILKFDFNGRTQYANPNVLLATKLKVKVVKGKNSRGNAQTPTEDEIKKQIKQVYPMSEVIVLTKAELVTLNRDQDAEKGLSNALGIIDKLRKQEDKNSHYYGFVPGICSGVVGLGYVGAPSAVGLDKSNCGAISLTQTMMHELGHNFGLNHAPCGTKSGLDPFWKKSNAYLGVENAELRKVPLFDHFSNKVKSPLNSSARDGKERDLMAYCGGTWASDYNYNKVASFVGLNEMYKKSAFKKPQEIPTSGLVLNNLENSNSMQNNNSNLQDRKTKEAKFQRIISGEILYDKNQIILEPIELTSNNLPVSYIANDFGYMMLIKIGSNQTLYPLQVKRLDHSPRMFFELILPIDEENQKIDELSFWQGNEKIPYKIADLFEVNSSDEAKAPLAFFRSATFQPLEINSKAQEVSNLQGKDIKFQNNQIFWNSQKYPFMTSVFIADNGERKLLVSKAKGGFFKIKTKLDKGKLEIQISDGINTKIKIVD